MSKAKPKLRAIPEPDLAALELKRPEPPDPIQQPVVDFLNDRNMNWRCGRWELLVGDFPELTEEDVPEFWKKLGENARWKIILRRIYGFAPTEFGIKGSDPEDFRPWTRDELAAHFAITRINLDSEIDSMRQTWRRVLRLKQAAIQSTKSGRGNQQVTEGKIEKIDEDDLDEYLVRFGVDPIILHLPQRSAQDNLVEKAWFVKRLKEWEPLLTKSTMTERLALDTIHNELRLRREQSMLWRLDREINAAKVTQLPGLTKSKQDASDRVKELQQLHADQLNQINEHAPWFNVTEGQISATGAVSQIVQGMQEYYAKGDTKLLDTVFTGTELQVLMRTSRQIDEPRYRLGWVFYVNESRNWIWDQKAKPWMTNRDLAKWDNAFKETVKKFNEFSDEKVVDLEEDGPAGEYADLYAPV